MAAKKSTAGARPAARTAASTKGNVLPIRSTKTAAAVSKRVVRPAKKAASSSKQKHQSPSGRGKNAKLAAASTGSPASRPAAALARQQHAEAKVAAPQLPADIVDRQLEKYRSMRNFGVTAEPSGDDQTGAKATVASLPFCIQKHAASHLHYDFRLGWNGVLKSWAVAKGPSYVTADKRLAVQVEDHPMEYGGFEGIIPKGQYGGGTVMLWDEGTWQPQAGYEDVDKGLLDGSLKLLLFGTKMHGKWALIRMGGRFAQERKPNWLLIKEHDGDERTPTDPAVTEAEPNSAATGRTMEQIAANEDHVWNSKDTATKEGRAWYRKQPAPTLPAASAMPSPQTQVAPRKAQGLPLSSRLQLALSEAPQEPQPEFLKPQLAAETIQPPEGEGWLHELKLDGYRMQARKSARGVEMLTRSGLDWTYRVPSVAEAVSRLSVDAVTLDGEVVVLRDDGTTNFADLQASFQEGAQHPLVFFCFDLLHLQGHNVRGLPLRERKELLEAVLTSDSNQQVRLSEHIETGGAELFRHACELHAEGILSKAGEAPYRAGRNSDWLKSKCLHEQEFVIGGFTLPSNGIHGVGALLLGYYSGRTLVYAGRTGTGFTQKTHRTIRDRLDALQTKSKPFAHLPSGAGKDAHWVRPELVAQVRFATWTADNLVRQAAFLGLREDKSAQEVVRETAGVAPRPKQQKAAERNGGPPQKAAIPAGRNGSPSAKQPVPIREAAPTTASAAHANGNHAVASGVSRAGDRPAIRLTHPAKVLDQQTGVTKQMLADFYWAVSERMLPHVAGRPLSLVRCPEGSERPCFYQKHVNHLLPAGVGAVDVPDKRTGITEPYITLSSPEALAGLAQMGVLEVHPWGSRNGDLEHPDRLILDLDPDEALPWRAVTEAALNLRERLQSVGIKSFVKTTGGKGLHLVAPLTPGLDWNQLKDLAHAFVGEMERERPELYLTKMTKAARKGKIYLDYLRNDRGATAVAPYSPRARTGMPVSVPLDWEELRSAERPQFTVAGFAGWQDRLREDLWRGMDRVKQKFDL